MEMIGLVALPPELRRPFPQSAGVGSSARPTAALNLALKAGSNLDSIYANLTTVDTISDQSVEIRSIISYKTTPLLCAAAIGDIAVVNRLSEAGAEPLRVDDKRQTALHLAAQQGHGDVAMMLTQRYPSLLSVEKGSNGDLPIVDAAPHRDVFRQVLDGMDPGMCATGLEIAARLGYEDIFHWLLGRGVELDLDRWNDHRHDALVRVCLGADESHVRIVEYLLGVGVATDLIYEVDDFDDMTALHVVCAENKPNVLDMARILLDNGADLTTTTGFGDDEDSSLQAACSTGNIDLVKLLWSYITDPAMPYGGKYFNKGYADACWSDNIECVQLIFDRFPVVLFDTWLGNRCLANACRSGNLKVVQMLLDKGVTTSHCENDVEDELEDFFGPLCYAWRRGDLQLIQLLIDAGVLPDKDHFIKRSPFLYYSWPNVSDEMQLACFQLLVSAGADPTLSTPSGDDPLLGACAVGATSCVKLLLDKYGLKIKQRQRPFARNCLHLAAPRGSLETVKVLLEHGADANSIADSGYTPLHFAVKVTDKSKREALVAYLLSRGANADARAHLHSELETSPLYHLIHASQLSRPKKNSLDQPNAMIGL